MRDYYGTGIFGAFGSGVQSNPFNTRQKHDFTPAHFSVHREHWIKMLRDVFIELIASRFEWEGLPEDMPPYYLERMLITRGRVLLFESAHDGILAAPGAPEGLNHYYQPLRFTIESPTTSGTYDLNKDKCVLVQNTSVGDSDHLIIENFIKVLAELKVTQNINMQTMKTPFILKGNDKTMRTLYEQLNQIATGQTHIMLDADLYNKSGSELDVLALNTPFYIDKLQEHFLDVKGELYEILGIDTNPNPRKKERMISGEVETNDQAIAMNRATRLKMRETAAEKASAIFGTKITVKYSEDFNDGIDSLLHDSGGAGHDTGDDAGVGQQDTGQ